MKTVIKLSIAFILLVGFSCKKKESEVPSVSDYREKYVGTYRCLLRNIWRIKDSVDGQGVDTSYITTIEIKKNPKGSNNLVLITDPNSSLEISFFSDTEFTASVRCHGRFYAEDSLYINNSHPAGIYSYIYHGKKIN